MATRETTTGGPETRPSARMRRRLAIVLLATGLGLIAIWFAWRVATLGAHPIQIFTLLVELSGWTAAVLVASGLLAAPATRVDVQTDHTYRYAAAVADHVGRTRSADPYRDVRDVVDTVVARFATRTFGDHADRAMVGVLMDGPRRIALVGALSLALLLGVSPAPIPPAWALVAVIAGTALVAAATVIASDGRIRFGDRLRWSFASIGEVIAQTDRADVAPRRWVGTVATVVALNIAIALRGMSDRWTHGLPAMNDDERLVTIMWATLLVVGGLYTLRTIPTPRLRNEHLVARRLEERTARQSALGATVCLGIVGLLAGVLPGSVDAGADDPLRVEAPAQVVADGGAGG